MAKHPPFMNAVGTISKVLDRIQEAKTPPKFTQDFLAEVLKCPGGSAKPVIPLLKRLGFLSADGSPSARYKRFRNPDSAGVAMKEAIIEGYADLYARNEFVHELDKERLKNLVLEATGLESESTTVRAIVGSFEALKSYADFDAEDETPDDEHEGDDVDDAGEDEGGKPNRDSGRKNFGSVGVTYQINLVMPDTDDPAVFAAIFKSMREHLF